MTIYINKDRYDAVKIHHPCSLLPLSPKLKSNHAGRHQTNPNWGISCKIPDQSSSKVPRSRKPGKDQDSHGLKKIKETRRLNATRRPGCHPGKDTNAQDSASPEGVRETKFVKVSRFRFHGAFCIGDIQDQVRGEGSSLLPAVSTSGACGKMWGCGRLLTMAAGCFELGYPQWSCLNPSPSTYLTPDAIKVIRRLLASGK